MKGTTTVNDFKDLKKAIEEITKNQPAESRYDRQAKVMGYTTKDTATVVTEQSISEGKNLMPDVQKIVDTKGAAKVGGVMLDMFTASVLTQAYSKVSDANKKKMETANIQTLVKLAQKVMGLNASNEFGKDPLKGFPYNEVKESVMSEVTMGDMLIDIQQGASAKEISKTYKMPLSTAKDFLKSYYGQKKSPRKEGFSSDAQRRAAFANGYQEKGKKKKDKKEEIVKEMNTKMPEKVRVQVLKHMNNLMDLPYGSIAFKKEKAEMEKLQQKYSVKREHVNEEVIAEALSKLLPKEKYARMIGLDKAEIKWIEDNEEDSFYANNSAMKKEWLALSYPIRDGDYYFVFNNGGNSMTNAKVTKFNNKMNDALSKFRKEGEKKLVTFYDKDAGYSKADMLASYMWNEMSEVFEKLPSGLAAGDTMTREALYTAINHMTGGGKLRFESVDESINEDLVKGFNAKKKKKLKNTTSKFKLGGKVKDLFKFKKKMGKDVSEDEMSRTKEVIALQKKHDQEKETEKNKLDSEKEKAKQSADRAKQTESFVTKSPFKLKSKQYPRAIAVESKGYGQRHATYGDIEEACESFGMITDQELQIEQIQKTLGKSGFLTYNNTELTDIFEDRETQRMILALESVTEVQTPTEYNRTTIDRALEEELHVEFVKPDGMKAKGPVLKMSGNTYNLKDMHTGKSFTFKYIEEAMKIKDIFKKHKRELTKAYKTGDLSFSSSTGKKAEEDLMQWAMDNGEVKTDDPDEFFDWMSSNIEDIVKGKIREMNEGSKVKTFNQIINEGKFPNKLVKMAGGIAFDKRFIGGNMTGAIKAIEKLKKGLSDDPKVRDMLKIANEAFNSQMFNSMATEDKDAYVKFFNSALKKFGVNSPSDMDTEKKKEFFNYIDKNYKAKDEMSENPQHIKHQCATHVEHAVFGAGTTVSGQHTLVQEDTGDYIVTHYDIEFPHGIEEMVSVSELSITKSEGHQHSMANTSGRKKLKASKKKELQSAVDGRRKNFREKMRKLGYIKR